MGDAKQDVLDLIRLIAGHRGMVEKSIEERALELQVIGECIDQFHPAEAMMGWMSHRLGITITRGLLYQYMEHEEVTGEGEDAVVNWWPSFARYEKKTLGSYQDEYALQELARLLFRADYGPDMAKMIGRMERVCRRAEKELFNHQEGMRKLTRRNERLVEHQELLIQRSQRRRNRDASERG